MLSADGLAPKGKHSFYDLSLGSRTVQATNKLHQRAIMNNIAKPKNNVINAGWAWKEQNSGKFLSASKTRSNVKRTEKKRVSSKCGVARRFAKTRLKAIGQPVLVKITDMMLIRRLHNAGLITIGGLGNISAKAELVYFYERFPVKAVHKNKPAKRKINIAVDAGDFYYSREWRALRYKALVKHGRQCQCCGAKPPQIVLHVDHIKPRSLHPELELDLDNLQILCEDCNLGKSNKDDTDFRA